MPAKRMIRAEHKVEYDALKNAIARCHNEKHSHYKNYGGRGITVSDEFKGDKLGLYRFIEEVGLRPGSEYSLDRIDNNKGYEPGNLRWATRQQQQDNRRPGRARQRDYGWGFGRIQTRGPHGSVKTTRSPLLELNGVKKTLVEWSRDLGIAASTLRQRLAKGWPIDVVLSSQKFSPSAKTLAAAIHASKTAAAVEDAITLLGTSISAINSRTH